VEYKGWFSSLAVGQHQATLQTLKENQRERSTNHSSAWSERLPFNNLMKNEAKIGLVGAITLAALAIGGGAVFIGSGVYDIGADDHKLIHPFGDFLLHDIGTGDGIVQVGPQDTADKLRTAPLWGLRDKARFMHDLHSLSLENAIIRHEGEARESARRFRELSPEDREALITFLRTL
jgi:hypothetical protein